MVSHCYGRYYVENAARPEIRDVTKNVHAQCNAIETPVDHRIEEGRPGTHCLRMRGIYERARHEKLWAWLRNGTHAVSETENYARVSLSVTISAFFRIEFWPAWLSPRMRLSSPDHAPLIARTRVLAICSFCRFSSYNTASGRFYQPGETFMTHLTYS